MAKAQTSIGEIDATTPVGSIFTMDGGEQYTLDKHGSGSSVEIGGVGEADELAGTYTYDEWNNEYALFVTEINYPEAAEVETPEKEPVVDPALGSGDFPAQIANQPYGISAATMEAIEEARDEFKSAEAAYESLNDQAKAAKKDMEHAQTALNRAIDAMLDGELVRADGWPKDAPLATVADEAPAAEGDDGWKAVELADLTNPHIKVGILKVLAENGIHTMGQLAEWQAEKQDFWAKDLKGVGKAACDSISDATDAYWTRNPRPAADVPFAPPAE